DPVPDNLLYLWKAEGYSSLYNHATEKILNDLVDCVRRQEVPTTNSVLEGSCARALSEIASTSIRFNFFVNGPLPKILTPHPRLEIKRRSRRVSAFTVSPS